MISWLTDKEGGSRISHRGNQLWEGLFFFKMFQKTCIKKGTWVGACSMPGVLPSLGSTNNKLKHILKNKCTPTSNVYNTPRELYVNRIDLEIVIICGERCCRFPHHYQQMLQSVPSCSTKRDFNTAPLISVFWMAGGRRGSLAAFISFLIMWFGLSNCWYLLLIESLALVDYI